MSGVFLEAGTSPLSEKAIRRFAHIYEVESELAGLHDEEGKALRPPLAKPLWTKFKTWLMNSTHPGVADLAQEKARTLHEASL